MISPEILGIPVKMDPHTHEGKAEMNIAFQDPRQVCELHSAFYNIQFPQSGEYRFQLLHEGEPLMERRLLLRRIDPKKMRPPQGHPPGPPGGPPMPTDPETPSEP